MSLSTMLRIVFKWLVIASLIVFVYSYFTKDIIPEANYYDLTYLTEPIQRPINKAAFEVEVNNQNYIIKPKYDYELEGVIVSYHDADEFTDITHYAKWLDFLNLRDLCVIWGDNVSSGVYKNMDFDNDSWTCWARWPDSKTGRLFSMNQLSNNHILSHDENINSVLMAAEPGDHIRLSGYLAEYSNPGNGFKRGTSTIRNDTGSGACETIYLTDFEIINKANPRIRKIYTFSKWTFIFALLGYIVFFFISPVIRH